MLYKAHMSEHVQTATKSSTFEKPESPVKEATSKTLPARKRKNVDEHLSEKLLMEVEDSQDVDPLDDSFKDKSYEPNHETIEDEDKDDLEQKCDFCSYHTFWDDHMKQHTEWKHSTLVRQAKQSKKIKAPNSKNLNLTENVILVEKYVGKGGT